MCLLSVKEEPNYSVPARVKEVRWTRKYSSSPPQATYYSKTRVVEAPSAPPPVSVTQVTESRTEVKSSEAASPTSAKSVAATETKKTSIAPSTTRTHYVEVEHDDSESEAGPRSSINDDVRSRTTHKTSKTSNTQKSSKSKNTPLASKAIAPAPKPTTPTSDAYNVHEREREIRRERTYSRPRDDFETYRYVNAPPDMGRSRNSGGYYDPRAIRNSYGREGQGYYR